MRLVCRTALLVALLAVCVTGFYLRRLIGGPNRWPRRFLGAVARSVGVRVRMVGSAPDSGAVLLANHVSWIDICALAGATGTAFVAHEGLASIGPLRWLCDMNDTVFIARHRRASVSTQVDQIRQAAENSNALTIFPEGTTSDGSGVLPFKSSLLAALQSMPLGTPVHPVLLDYGRDAARVAWVGAEHGFDNFKRILGRREPIDLTIHVLPALEPSTRGDRKLAASTAREALLQALARSPGQRVAL